MNWDYEKIYFSGDNYYRDLVLAIGEARISIEMLMYIFDSDPIGDRIVDAMVAASERGVRVRMIVDGVGSRDFQRRYGSRCERAGIGWMYYHPLPWQKVHELPGKQSFWSRLTSFWGKFNRRNHCKFFVMDSALVFSGSINITRLHSQEFSGVNAWQDIGLQVKGDGAQELVNAFEWQYTRRPLRPSHNQPKILLNHTLALRRQINNIYVRGILRAERDVTLVTPYFVPPRALVRAILIAASRGVHVRLLSTQKTDVWMTRFIARTYYRTLIRRGVEIWEFTSSLLHAKASLVDDEFYVGSANFNHRSFFKDLEVSFQVNDPNARQCLENGIADFFKNATKQTVAELDRYGMFERIMTRLFFFIRYMS